MYGIHNNHDHIDEGKRVKGDRGWEKGEGGRMERGGRQEIKEKRGRREKTTPCPPPHRFRDIFCLFGITNAHHTPVI